jgi:hypothetical protein
VVAVNRGRSSEIGLATAELSRQKGPMFGIELFVLGGRADI